MKLYIENLGCAKNQVDAEVMAFNLKKDGYELTEQAEEADLIVVNTCGFIESAKEESLNTFFGLRNQYPQKKIILAGCLAQRYAEDLGKDLPEADAVFGNRDISKIRELVKQSSRSVLVPDYPAPEAEEDTRDKLFCFPGSAYLKISEGCNHCCSYCAIPVIRGSLRSRPDKAVLKEAERLVKSGIKEINLIAQDLAAYGFDWDGRSHFCELLEKLCRIEGDFRIRMLYIHPDWMTDEIISAVKNNDKILHYFDIPFQHASSNILLPMKRTGNQDSYAHLVEKIRKEIPDCVIRTTIMLGFPGDTVEDYRIVEQFIKRCEFNWMGAFVYSREEDTPAFDMTDEDSHNALAKKAAVWKKKLEGIQEKITSERLGAFVGNVYNVLIEELVKGEELAIGRIYAQAPDVDGLTVVMGRDMLPGNVYLCLVSRVNGIDLEAVKL